MVFSFLYDFYLVYDKYVFPHLYRFLSQFCEPIIGESEIGASRKSSHLEKVSMSVYATVFSCNIDAIENYFPSENGGGTCNMGLIDGTSDYMHLLDAIGASIYYLGLTDVVQRSLSSSLRGEHQNDALDVYLRSQHTLSTSTDLHWIGGDLLIMPMLETLVLGLSLGSSSLLEMLLRTPSCGEAPDHYHNMINFYQWICVARLTQLLIAESMDVRKEIENREEDIECKKERRCDGALHDRSNALVSLIHSIARAIISSLFPIYEVEFVERLDMCSVLHKWLKFIRNASNIMHRCKPGLLPLLKIRLHEDALFMEMFDSEDVNTLTSQIDQCMSYVSLNMGGIDLSSSIDRFVEGVALWIRPLVGNEDSLHKVGIVSSDGSCFRKPSLVRLPDSYTELHGKVLSTCDYEYPAICLVCGSVLDAGGKGECTAHSRLCSPEGGIFFLLQDCNILLLYGSRASYYTSPYVDSHGEEHQHFKGRPLFLDRRRLVMFTRSCKFSICPNIDVVQVKHNSKVLGQSWYST